MVSDRQNEPTRHDLLPCPFCGASAVLLHDKERTWGLITHDPGCWLAYGMPRRRQEIPPAEFDAWNRRAEGPAAEGPADYLCDMCANDCDERRVIRVGQGAYTVCDRWQEAEE